MRPHTPDSSGSSWTWFGVVGPGPPRCKTSMQPVNPLAFDRRNQTPAGVLKHSLVLISAPWSLHGDMHYVQYVLVFVLFPQECCMIRPRPCVVPSGEPLQIFQHEFCFRSLLFTRVQSLAPGRSIMSFKARSHVLPICIYHNWCLGCILKPIILPFFTKKKKKEEQK